MTSLRRLARIGVVAASAAVAVALASVVPASADRSGDDLRFADRSIVVSESAGRAVVSVQREATFALEQSDAWFATYERTAGPSDFNEASGWLRMAVGQTTSSIVIYVRDDTDDEPLDETFVVRLSTNAYGTDIIDEAIVTIRDDDDPPEPVEYLQPEDVSAASEPVTAAAAPPAVARQVVQPAARTDRAATNAGARRQPAARVTPFELRTPGENGAESIPVPEHASPLAAGAFLAALGLAKVSAEAWYRWRTLVD